MLLIHEQASAKMIADAESAFPDECCGFVFGTEESTTRIVTEIKVVNNSKEGDKRRRFEIAAKDYLLAEKFADENGLLLLGVYHSHPGHPAIPSEHDRVAAQPYFSYIILSIIEGKHSNTRSWRLNEQQQFEEEHINVHQLI